MVNLRGRDGERQQWICAPPLERTLLGGSGENQTPSIQKTKKHQPEKLKERVDVKKTKSGA